MRTALVAVGTVLLLISACAMMPTRPPPKPVELRQLAEPSDTYQWVSRGGLTLRVRLPRRLGKPKGEWYIEAPPEPAPVVGGPPPPRSATDAAPRERMAGREVPQVPTAAGASVPAPADPLVA